MIIPLRSVNSRHVQLNWLLEVLFYEQRGRDKPREREWILLGSIVSSRELYHPNISIL